ncbi:SGNH/GDSL hydrolase family protein [Fangia hongkongensis]|uniref:SGNH/GDSL hydrolase family protein n=1 Tax=Fangia hongkongensis TaxID=270495 RepID=UPI0004782168|nr:SGNH/GDSL hydrolase family protein [Fangia hongkongensis]MBK2124207.1 SGNH/GDSL hydrolase family protein [Fangia hongkongensis]
MKIKIMSLSTVLLSMALAGCGGSDSSSSNSAAVSLASNTNGVIFSEVGSGVTTEKSYTLSLQANNIAGIGTSTTYHIELSGLSSPFQVVNNTCANGIEAGKSCAFSIRYTPASSEDYHKKSTLYINLSDQNGKSVYATSTNVDGEKAPSIYIFGDSLSDGGYQDLLYKIYSDQWPKIPNTNTPKAPTFTTPGGMPWSEALATYLGEAIQVNNTNPVPSTMTSTKEKKGNNYAAGGATTTCTGITSTNPLNGELIYSPPPIGPSRSGEKCQDANIESYNQIDNYLSGHNHVADSSAIYILWGGANNILKAQGSPNTLPEVAINAAKDIAYDVEYLYQKGARKFIILNLPNLGLTPSATENGKNPENKALSSIAELYNTTLQSALGALKLSGLSYQYIDTYTLLSNIVADKSITSFGKEYTFTNVTSAACAKLTDSAINCIPETSKLTGYVFEDGVHPTTTVHQIIRNYVYQAIENLYTPQ